MTISEPDLITHLAFGLGKSGTRPQALEDYDYDHFAKSLYRIKDEGDKSPLR